jgi:hypothetical protein
MLIGGMLVVMSLPILAPLIVGTLVTGAIHGVHELTRNRRSDQGRDE